MADEDLEMSLSEDDLISGLFEAKEKRVEVIAFGIAYAGRLAEVNVRSGFIVVIDGETQATLELERIESYRLLE